VFVVVLLVGAAVGWWTTSRRRSIVPPANPPAATQLTNPTSLQLATPRPTAPVVPIATAIVALGVDDTYRAGTVRQTQLLIQALGSRLLLLSEARPAADVIREQYALTPAEQPEHYALVASAIARLNPGQSLARLQPGALLIPMLPRRAAADAARRAPIDVTLAVRDVEGRGRLMVSQAALSDTATTPAPRPFLRVAMPMETLTTDAVAELLRGPGAALLSFPLNVVFAASPAGGSTASPCPVPPYTTFVDRAALEQTLRAATQDVTLFVLDSGWPSEEDWRSSRAYLSEMCARARRHYRIEASIRDFSAAPTASFPVPANTHSQDIRLALREFDGLDAHVKVVYVPLTRDQGADDILQELFEIDYIGLRMAQENKDRPEDVAASIRDGIVNDAKGHARQLVAQLPPAAASHLPIDGGLMSALLETASLDAAAVRRPFFVNASWWSPDRTVRIVWPSASLGFIVAAAGNEQSPDIENPMILLAGLSRENARILAVLALDTAGRPACCTSQVNYARNPVSAAGYYSGIPAPRCGSSTAAPRVAWVLAARDTLSAGPIHDPQRWFADIKDRLRRIRPSRPMPEALLFDPVQYLAAPD
jgi:hypothetical protein